LHAAVDGLIGYRATNEYPPMYYTFAEFRDGVNQLVGTYNVGYTDPRSAIESALKDLDRKTGGFSAAWMAGYARVTAVLPPGGPLSQRYLVASPLYVERVPKPSDQ
jgi:hypothetical protein